jgi:hypothetical protein
MLKTVKSVDDSAEERVERLQGEEWVRGKESLRERWVAAATHAWPHSWGNQQWKSSELPELEIHGFDPFVVASSLMLMFRPKVFLE